MYINQHKFITVTFTLLLSNILISYAIDPISTGAYILGGVILSGGYAGWEFMKCRMAECCDNKWVRANFEGLEKALLAKLHGQSLVHFTVVQSLKGHIRNKHSDKALVMSFHGWTGGGKNYVSKIIAEHLYMEGTKSRYVHWYIATKDFPHKDEVQKYVNKLHEEIPKFTKECGQSLFIFDEMDKMPPGVIDALKPYVDYHENIDGIDYRKNIFIFLSNAGGNDITRIAYNFWLKGKDREEITMRDIEPIINRGAFNEKGGLRHSEIIEKNLIDVYVPFLPLERKHIKLCIKDELRSRNTQETIEIIEKVADQLQYFPEEFQLYSTSGCKLISKKLNLYINVIDFN